MVSQHSTWYCRRCIRRTTKYITERNSLEEEFLSSRIHSLKWLRCVHQTEAAKLLVYQAACAKDDHEPFSHKAAMAKLVAARNAMDVTTRCLQLYGGYGYTKDYPIERMMRDAKITEIYEGTSEVQMMVISGWMGVK